jgi:FAD/FMN-containing dehydrogenase
MFSQGIGQLKAKYLKLAKSKEELAVFRDLKMLFDPNMTLNAGKILESTES